MKPDALFSAAGIRTLATAHRLANLAFRRALKARHVDLRPEQWVVLAYLQEQGSASQNEIADFACVDKASISRTVTSMVGRGLLHRKPASITASKNEISATAVAEPLRKVALKAARDVGALAFDGVSEEDAKVFLRVLDAIRKNLR